MGSRRRGKQNQSAKAGSTRAWCLKMGGPGRSDPFANGPCMTALCAFETFVATSRIDVKRTLRMAGRSVAVGPAAHLYGRLGNDRSPTKAANPLKARNSLHLPKRRSLAGPEARGERE
jgi:hypothetical protein